MKNVKLLIGCLVSSIFIILHAQTFICAQTPTDVIAPQEVHVVTNAVNHELTAGMLDSTVVVFNDIHLEAAVRDVLGKPTGDI